MLAALQAGKHVYCEAPLASSIEDARVIAQAAKAAIKLNFQTGLQLRSDERTNYVYNNFIRVGAAGSRSSAADNGTKKTSWRPTPNPDREKEMNWRLSSATSGGLMGKSASINWTG